MRALVFSSGSFIDHLADSLGILVASLSNLSGKKFHRPHEEERNLKGSGYEFATCM